jgi:hypothetical protein
MTSLRAALVFGMVLLGTAAVGGFLLGLTWAFRRWRATRRQ